LLAFHQMEEAVERPDNDKSQLVNSTGTTENRCQLSEAKYEVLTLDGKLICNDIGPIQQQHVQDVLQLIDIGSEALCLSDIYTEDLISKKNSLN